MILSGLPGVGKTTLARAVARSLGAAHLRIDTIEAALTRAANPIHATADEGYVVGYALAADQLRIGLDVVADSVNPVGLTRAGWRAAAAAAGATPVDVEVVCSDPAEHRARVEDRRADMPGQRLPDWAAVLARDYAPWTEPVMRIDTAGRSPEECCKALLAALS